MVEVLVALAIVAVALLASVRAVGTMTESSAELRLRLLAQLSARNQISLLRASKSFPPIGVVRTECPQGNVALVCRVETKATPNWLFRRAEVRVYATQETEHHVAYLVGILPREGGP